MQTPSFASLTRVARRCGVATVCIPNWEWLDPGDHWVHDVDVMLSPTHTTAAMLSDWKQRFGFDWEIRVVPWPIDTRRFAHRRRDVARRFVYIHGSGGGMASDPDGRRMPYRRKGGELILAAARELPRVPFIVYAGSEPAYSVPPNIDLRPFPEDNRQLYRDGDICVQPSHWEGLGLPLLECQASGMPLITTAAPPMSEHRPHACVPVQWLRPVILGNRCSTLSAEIHPDDLARVLRGVHGRWISLASVRARRFVARHHSWGRRRREVISAIAAAVAKRATATASGKHALRGDRE